MTEFEKKLDLLDKVVDEKLKNLNTIIPVLITIVIGILAMFLTTGIDKKDEPQTYNGFLVVIICSLIMFIALLLMNLPFKKYTDKHIKEKNSPVFDLSDFGNFKVKNTAFNKMLIDEKGEVLTSYELQYSRAIKQKINMYFIKRILVLIVLGLIIAGAIACLVTSCFMFV